MMNHEVNGRILSVNHLYNHLLVAIREAEPGRLYRALQYGYVAYDMDTFDRRPFQGQHSYDAALLQYTCWR